jgi:hypothetical protein
MERIELYRQFTDALFSAYKEELEIKTLAEYEFEGRGSAAFMTDITRKKESIHPLPYSDFKIHDELNFISKDIKYVTGMLHILRPYINNAFKDEDHYRQTLEDSRYLMYANFGLQSIYNFWDRLGDLLFLYFKTGLAVDQVFFGRVVNNMEATYRQTDSYKNLLDLYNLKVKSIFDTRHEAVHHFQLECKHYWGNLEYRSDKQRLAELNAEKRVYVDTMKEQLDVCCQGFLLTLKLLDELPDKNT